ncbi:MAPEG family protein [Zavarzinia sp.]|uniref:MAPEG family protein n=1 Tax=Zavarzinia sp. TaxID=2027920 RepID=UPI003565042E
MTDPVTASFAVLPHWSLLYAGLNALVTFGLAFRVGLMRGRYKVMLGDGGVPEVHRAIRAHGNNVEYVPLVLVLVALLELAGQPAWVIHLFGGMLLAGRILHGVGLSLSEGAGFGRGAGIGLTWLALLGAAGWCIYLAVA